jgi:hypothetical protein
LWDSSFAWAKIYRRIINSRKSYEKVHHAGKWVSKKKLPKMSLFKGDEYIEKF